MNVVEIEKKKKKKKRILLEAITQCQANKRK
jgi:hypothetical protein